MSKMKSRSDCITITVDKARAVLVLRPLYEAFVNQRQLFAHISREVHAPQRRFFPEGVQEGGLDHRRWLFFAAMTDRREVSWRVYESHARLWVKEQKLYSEHVLGMSSIGIAKLLAGENIGSPAQSARYWPRSAETLFGSFGGDPLSMYQQFGSVQEILAFKKRGGSLPGFGPKILSLLAMFYAELGLMVMPLDAFPVDVHVQRFAISTGVIMAEVPLVNEQVESALRPLLCEICIEEGWNPLLLSHAIWFLGNQCCSGCYRNRAVEFLCPSYEMCGGSISTLTYFRRGTWDMTAPRHNKGGQRNFVLSSAPLFL